MTNLREHFIRVHKVSDNYCGIYKSIFLGPKRLLKTQSFEKKGNLSIDKKLWRIFPRSIEYDKPKGTIYKGPQGILTITVEIIRAFFETYRLLKTQIFEKKAVFPVKKILWPTFSRSIECDKPQGTSCKGPKGILTITVEIIRAFF